MAVPVRRLCLLLVLMTVVMDAASAQDSVTGCAQPGCIVCDESEDRCARCAGAIVLGTRQCVTACPGNFRLVHSDVAGYEGLLCRGERFLDTADLTVGEMSALVGALLLVAICIGLAIGVYMYFRLRNKLDPLRERLHTKEPEPFDTERVQYLTRLRALRPEAPLILEMLNEPPRPRSRISSGEEGRTSSRAQRASEQELRLVLVLLSRRDHQLGPPPADWQRLLASVERRLRQHRRHRLANKLSVPHIVPIPGHAHHGFNSGSIPRRPRSAAAAGRLLHSPHQGFLSPGHHSGSFFSLSQTVIEEEEDDGSEGSAVLTVRRAPPTNRRRRARAASANGVRRKDGNGSRERRRWRRGGRGRRNGESRMSGTDGMPVFVHRVNGGQGRSLWGPRPSSSHTLHRPMSAPTIGARSPSIPLPHVEAGVEERPTYRDWKSRHFGGVAGATLTRPHTTLGRPRSVSRHHSGVADTDAAGRQRSGSDGRRDRDDWSRRSVALSNHTTQTIALPSSVPGGDRTSVLGAPSATSDLPPGGGGFEVTSAGGSGRSAASTGLLLGAGSPLRWSRHDGGANVHSDRVESDSLGGFSGRYLHPHDLSTVL